MFLRLSSRSVTSLSAPNEWMSSEGKKNRARFPNWGEDQKWTIPNRVLRLGSIVKKVDGEPR